MKISQHVSKIGLSLITIFSILNVYANRGAYIVIRNSTPHIIKLQSQSSKCINGLDKFNNKILESGKSTREYLETSNSWSNGCIFESKGYGLINILDTENKKSVPVEYEISALIAGTKAGIKDSENNHPDFIVTAKSINILTRNKDQDLIIVRITPRGNDATKFINWMHHAAEKIKDIPLNQLTIPGTHDSFSNNLVSFTTSIPIEQQICGSELGIIQYKDIINLIENNQATKNIVASIIERYTKTQDLNFNDQLKHGIRYFDTRLCYKGNSTFTYHGLRSKETFINQIDKLSIFIQNNPQELVILDINHTENLNDDAFKTVLMDLNNQLKSLTPNLSTKQLSSLSPTSKISEFWNLQAQVIVIIPDKYYAIVKNIPYHFVLWPQDKINSPWANTTNARELINKNSEYLNNRPNEKLFVNQLQLTPNENYIKANIFNGIEFLAFNDLDDIIGSNGWLWVAPKAKPMNIYLQDFSDGYEQVMYSTKNFESSLSVAK